ncbi:uncharacterized protein K452DRAFT_354633 [Aplosporella prunicola CBS 121167]|uniref:Uncharacterized protein n=1 Tax=Aplosporella prunicola CBS 121167 TaxID=1176127 RepID=A0A6A6BT58_9PEZI|nr:uncharacterized protein K452DRAFT_354633 [Aplosporella prunicola CBS 121167]KAF2147180.1 hypothetical protein K452DRAFT_354633 [Aplosporella prunicola CBS 121167]
MSWMDSWSRPSKSQATPAPYYLLPGGEDTPYCKSCGRAISARKSQVTKETATPAKYCSSRCRSHKPGKLDRQIEDAFVAFLSGSEPLPIAAPTESHKKEKGQKKIKGDHRIIVPCDIVEEFVFGSRHDPEKDWGRKKNKARRGARDDDEWKSVDMMSTDGSVTASTASDGSAAEDNVIDGDLVARLSVRSGTRIRPAQDVSEVNGSVGGEKGRAERIEETAEMLEKRKEGEKRAEQRERVRCAARRGVAFGFVVQAADGESSSSVSQRKCEAMMQGKVVEASFAKGEWSVRWRE